MENRCRISTHMYVPTAYSMTEEILRWVCCGTMTSFPVYYLILYSYIVKGKVLSCLCVHVFYERFARLLVFLYDGMYENWFFFSVSTMCRNVRFSHNDFPMTLNRHESQLCFVIERENTYKSWVLIVHRDTQTVGVNNFSIFSYDILYLKSHKHYIEIVTSNIERFESVCACVIDKENKVLVDKSEILEFLFFNLEISCFWNMWK